MSLPRTVVASVVSLRQSRLEIGEYVFYEPLVSGSSLFRCLGVLFTVDICYVSAPGAFGRFSS